MTGTLYGSDSESSESRVSKEMDDTDERLNWEEWEDWSQEHTEGLRLWSHRFQPRRLQE